MKFLIARLFVGALTKNGYRLRAELLFLKVLNKLRQHYKKDPFEVLLESVDRARPSVKLSLKVVSGVNHRIPDLISDGSDLNMAVHWVVDSACRRSEKGLVDRLFNEIVDTYNGNSASISKKQELHKTALSNRPLLKFLLRK